MEVRSKSTSIQENPTMDLITVFATYVTFAGLIAAFAAAAYEHVTTPVPAHIQ